MNDSRAATLERLTRETRIAVELNLDGSGSADVDTGLGFLDHMLEALTFWARFDLSLSCDGDLHVDDHHTSEDCALAIGEAFDRALGEREGIERFGQAFAPMDEALCRTCIDLSGRPYAVIDLGLRRETIGTWATENVVHWFESFAIASRSTLHVDVLRGENDHHRIEAGFKSLGLALRAATAANGTRVPSTKGSI